MESLHYSLTQQTLRVAGPARTISTLESLTVTDFDLAREFEPGRDYQRLIELPAGIVSLDGVTNVTLDFDTSEMGSTKLNVSNIRAINVPSNYELQILSSLVSGVTLYGPADEIEKLFQRPAEGRAGSMADSALRQEKNLIICTATLVSRAAIRGGLDAETAFSLSDDFIQKAELLDNLEALTRLNARMVLEFARRVEDVRCGTSGSVFIRRAREYILTNLSEPITTAVLAKALGMNRTHLCERFVREIGMTVNAFVTAVKMDEAKRLLAVTKKSAVEIAEYLGYSSQSYFVKVFKKIHGVTPGEFRKG